MKYLVILEPSSAIGRTYTEGKRDACVMVGDVEYPVLDCTDINPAAPNYLEARRDLSNKRPSGGSHQTLLIPHHAVAWIQRYAEEAPSAPWPMGFVPTK